MSDTVVILVILIPIVAFLMICISIHANIKLYKLRKQPLIAKRNLFLYFGTNICLMLSILTTSILPSIVYTSGQRAGMPGVGLIFIGILFLSYCLNVRNWLIYYRYKWNYYTIEYNWKSMLNSSVSTQMVTNNWFIKHHATFGSPKYVKRFFGFVHAMVFICINLGTFIRFSCDDQTTCPQERIARGFTVIGLVTFMVM